MLTQDRLKQSVRYDAETGNFYRITNRKTNPNGFAGCISGKGYVNISVFGKTYLAHRLAWLYVTGAFPTECIDHVNGIKTDNRFANLREATFAQNSQNIVSKKNMNGLQGVSKQHNGTYMACIGCGMKRKYIGTFKTPEQAHEAYLKAKKQMHEFSVIERINQATT